MIITLFMPKGGQGKSTTSAILLSSSMCDGKRLGIDLDTQANLTAILGGDTTHLGVHELLSEECKLNDAVQTLESCDLLSASANLAELTVLPSDTLKRKIKDKYEWVIVDTSPVFNAVTINALVATDWLIAPVQADMLSLMALNQLESIVQLIRSESNPNLKIAGILLTHYNARLNLRKQMRLEIERIAERMGTRVFNSTIRTSVIVPESQAMLTPIWDYAPKAAVTEDYLAFVNELKGVISNG